MLQEVNGLKSIFLVTNLHKLWEIAAKEGTVYKEDITWPLRDTKFLFDRRDTKFLFAGLTHKIFFNMRREISYIPVIM